jgi:LytR cell envelope-related transcriptional attenuator
VDHALFRAIAHDAKLPKAAKRTPPAVLATTASPSQVQVTVLNGTSVAGLAGQVAEGLADRGFHIAQTGSAAHPWSRTVIEYSASSQLPKANALAAQIPGARVKKVAGLSPSGPVRMILGTRASTLKPGPKASAASQVAGLGSKYGGSTGTANCRSDTGAFQGPLSPSP